MFLNDLGPVHTLSVQFQPVPEPGTVLGTAAAGLALAGWVRRRAAASVTEGHPCPVGS